jgi:uncharacterized membrane protein
MSRLIAFVLALYGFRLSRRSRQTIARLGKEAAAGEIEVQQHFTQTRYARVFGPTNSELGEVFYGAAGLAAVTGLIRRRPILGPLLLGSTASVLTSLYLLWALFFRLRVWCAICMRAHIVNFSLFALLVRMWRGGGPR